MSNNLHNNSESPVPNLGVSFRQNHPPISFRVNLKADTLSGLPLPDLLAGFAIVEARLEIPKPKMKPLTIPKNSKMFGQLPPTKAKVDVFMLPDEVNDILTRFAQNYLSYQFTVKFIQYIQNSRNGVKQVVSDSQDLQEKLAYFQNNPANFNSLQFKLQDAEIACLNDLITVPTKILLRPDFLGWQDAKDLIAKTKDLADTEIKKFFQKGKKEVIGLSGFKEATLLDNMKTSDVGYNLIKKYEKFVPKLYSNDGGGRGGNCTIGYGHLIHTGPCTSADFAKYPNGISQTEAETTLRKDVEIVEDLIRNNVTVQLTQNQFDALISFLFTMGEGRFRTSTLLKQLNISDYDSVPVEMRKFLYSNGKLAPGLTPRREEEAGLFSGK